MVRDMYLKIRTCKLYTGNRLCRKEGSIDGLALSSDVTGSKVTVQSHSVSAGVDTACTDHFMKKSTIIYSLSRPEGAHLTAAIPNGRKYLFCCSQFIAGYRFGFPHSVALSC